MLDLDGADGVAPAHGLPQGQPLPQGAEHPGGKAVARPHRVHHGGFLVRRALERLPFTGGVSAGFAGLDHHVPHAQPLVVPRNGGRVGAAHQAFALARAGKEQVGPGRQPVDGLRHDGGGGPELGPQIGIEGDEKPRRPGLVHQIFRRVQRARGEGGQNAGQMQTAEGGQVETLHVLPAERGGGGASAPVEDGGIPPENPALEHDAGGPLRIGDHKRVAHPGFPERPADPFAVRVTAQPGQILHPMPQAGQPHRHVELRARHGGPKGGGPVERALLLRDIQAHGLACQ